MNTRNVFIECTATDLHKAEIVLDTIVTMFSEYCEAKFEIEAVEVSQLNGNKYVYPILNERVETIDTQEVCDKIGVRIGAQEMAQLLTRMGLDAAVRVDQQPNDHPHNHRQTRLQVRIPPTRSDILHACDIIEDVAIAYGFNNIMKTIPKTNTFSAELEINRLTDLLRLELAMCGYTEALTFTLVKTTQTKQQQKIKKTTFFAQSNT